MASTEISDSQALRFLSEQGWLPLVLADLPGFVSAYQSLQRASSSFFALPETSLEKSTYLAPSGAQASEEGYSKIPSEKSILTIRTASRCPETILDPLREAWNLTGHYLSEVLETIAVTLELDRSVFAPFAEPCADLPESERTPTLLRMFRYERPPGPQGKVNAQPHKDLGILSLVVGHSPGLAAIDSKTGQWISVEDESVLPAGTRERSGGFTATLLVGETLAYLSNGKYKAGAHGVVCLPVPETADSNDEESRWRYSMVFTLRPAVAPLWTKVFESRLTGRFPRELRVEGESSDLLFGKIMGSHFNINAAPDVREDQRKKLAAKEKRPETSELIANRKRSILRPRAWLVFGISLWRKLKV